jgi:hypothetical protein
MKIAFIALALIVVVLVLGPHFRLNPILPILALLGLGLYGVTRDAPVLTWRKGNFWGHGLGIYFDRDDKMVEGLESDTVYNNNDGAPRGKARNEKIER